MATFISKSPEETLALGREWGRDAQAGWLIGLNGYLGAGKTILVKGIAEGLGVNERIASPTFVLVHEYLSGRLPLYHLDLYRLDSAAQIAAAGLEEYLNGSTGVVVVEWIDRWKLETGGRRRMVRIDVVDEQMRRITYEDSGS